MTDDAPTQELSLPLSAAVLGPPDPENPLHLMIDLETLDTAPTALVLSAGWAWFDRNGIHSSSSMRFDHYLQHNGQDRTVSLDTIRWWHKQTTPMPESKHSFDVRMLNRELQRTHPYYGTEHPVDLSTHLVWSNSPSFDCVILRSWAERLRHALPWKFYQERDFRTLVYLVDKAAGVGKAERRSAQHDAEQDARDQAQFMIDNAHIVRF